MPRPAATVAALLAAPALICLFARAQEVTPPAAAPRPAGLTGPSSAPAAPRIDTLDQVLGQLAWNPQARGPLLIVDPKGTRRFVARPQPGQPFTTPAPLPPPGQKGYALEDVGAYFARKVVPLGTLSVLAPTTMVLLATQLPKADPYAGLDWRKRLELLECALTPAQLHKLGSQGGLGAGDLDREQRALFLSVLPEPFAVEQVTYGPDRRPAARTQTLTLSPEQRAGVRIALRRQMSWSLQSDPPGAIMSVGAAVPYPEGTQVLQLPTQIDFRSFGPRQEAFGAQVRQEVPSRLKPGQLNFAAPALDAAIPLSGASSVGEVVQRAARAARVELYADRRMGDLPLSVLGVGQMRVRAGDALRALCWAVTGTFRRVGDPPAGAVFVLTDDLQGLGARHALLSAWGRENEALYRQMDQDLWARLRAQEIHKYVGWEEGDPLTPGPDLLRQIEAHREALLSGTAKTIGGLGYLPVPVSALPPPAQGMLAQQLESHHRMEETRQRLRQSHPLPAGFPEEPARSPRADQVLLDVQIRPVFLVPGLGKVETSRGYSSSRASLFLRPGEMPLTPRPPAAAARPAPERPPVSLPPAMKTRALCVAPATAQEARDAAEAAGRKGLNHLWVQVQAASEAEAGTAAALLEAAVAAGKGKGLSVYAVARLLRLPPAAPAPGQAADVNILGETAPAFAARLARIRGEDPATKASPASRREDWLRCDLPEVLAERKGWLLRLAGVPGLAGLALRDTAAPGYLDTAGIGSYVVVDAGGLSQPRGYTPVEELGYAEPMRLAFVRQASIDPIDLSPTGGFLGGIGAGGPVGLGLPFLPDQGPGASRSLINGRPATEVGAKDAAGRWKALRQQTNGRFLAELYRALRAAHPDLPLFVRERSGELSGAPSGWWGSWDKAEVLPLRTYRTEGPRQSAAQMARSQSRSVLLGVGYLTPLPDARAPGATPGVRLPVVPTAAPARADRATRFADQLRGYLSSDKGSWDGIVLDLSSVPVGEALGLLEGIAAATAARSSSSDMP